MQNNLVTHNLGRQLLGWRGGAQIFAVFKVQTKTKYKVQCSHPESFVSALVLM